MTDDAQQQNDEHQRFRARLDFYLAELEAVRTQTSPFHELRLEAFRALTSYAQSALKAAFLLNGGALIAVPAFQRLIDSHGQAGWYNLSNILALFVVGLIFCTIASLFAFLSAQHETNLAATWFEYATDLVTAQFRRAADSTIALPDEAAHLKSVRKFRRRSSLYRQLAICSGVLSIGGFGAGAYLAYEMFQL